MDQQQFISILLAIVGFIGVLMVSQLMRIAKSVSGIREDIKVLANDHGNLKEDHKELKKDTRELSERVLKLEKA